MSTEKPTGSPSEAADCSSADRLQRLAHEAFEAIEKNTGHRFRHDTVEQAFLAFQRIAASLGLTWLIDAANGTGMTHLGWCAWMNDARKILGIQF